MRPISMLFLLIFSFIQSTEFIIRPTEPQDLIPLKDLSKKIINEYFRKSITTGYPDSPIVENKELLEAYLKNMIENFSTIFEEKALKDPRLLLLTAIDPTQNKIIGFCFSQQLNQDEAYIRYIIVDENYRDKGIGTTLLQSTINSHQYITSYQLKTLAYGNEKTHAFYQAHGFISDNKPKPLMHKLCNHSDTITFIAYQLKI